MPDNPVPPPVPAPPISTTTADPTTISSVTEKPKKGWSKGKKTILTILGVLFLIGGVGVGVVLVRQQQDIRERAQQVQCQNNAECAANEICVDNQCVATAASATPTPTPSPSPTPTVGGQCLEIKAFDISWNLLTSSELAKLKAGDTVRFTASGTATQGEFDAARFTINGNLKPQVTTKRPNTNEFYYEYTIPDGVTDFEIKAELHHAGLDLWL